MNAQEEAQILIQYIGSISGFQFTQPGYPYNHVGATIVDAILQAGLNWRIVVKPRIDEVRAYSNAGTTSGFLSLLNHLGARELLDWRDDEKPNRVINLTRFFANQGIENESDLKLWLSNQNNESKLLTQRGIGKKTLDYIKMLSGLQSVAVHRHIIKFVNKSGIVWKTYSHAHSIVQSAARLLEIQETMLDHSIWRYISKK
jgi:hypothetical protein